MRLSNCWQTLSDMPTCWNRNQRRHSQRQRSKNAGRKPLSLGFFSLFIACFAHFLWMHHRLCAFKKWAKLVFRPKPFAWRAGFYSQTEMDLKNHRCIVSKQKVPLFLCVRVCWLRATRVLRSSNNCFPKAILFDYNPNRALTPLRFCALLIMLSVLFLKV